MSALQDSHPLNQYRDLVMPDDCIYPTEGGFEGDELADNFVTLKSSLRHRLVLSPSLPGEYRP